jgi:hypothetical protein
LRRLELADDDDISQANAKKLSGGSKNHARKRGVFNAGEDSLGVILKGLSRWCCLRGRG